MAGRMAREVPADIQANGGTLDLNDGAGPHRLTGVAYRLVGLARALGPLIEETTLSALWDMERVFPTTRRMHRRDAEQVAGRRPPCGHSGRHADSTTPEILDAALGHAPSTSTLVRFAQAMARNAAAG